jgi:antitoxin ParD1/3/4
MEPAQKISIAMPLDLIRAIRESVEAGEYASTSEALPDAVRLRQRQRLEDAERLVASRPASVARSRIPARPSPPRG